MAPQHPIQVFDEDGTLIGDYSADLLVNDQLIVELKAARTLAAEHTAQIPGYLKSARIEPGLFLNFGSDKFEVRKFVRTDQAPRAYGRVTALFSALFSLKLHAGCDDPFQSVVRG